MKRTNTIGMAPTGLPLLARKQKEKLRSRLARALTVLGVALVSAAPSAGLAVDFAVWLDGNTTPGGGGNPILTEIDHYLGTNDYELVTTAQLETPGFLNTFNCVVVSR